MRNSARELFHDLATFRLVISPRTLHSDPMPPHSQIPDTVHTADSLGSAEALSTQSTHAEALRGAVVAVLEQGLSLVGMLRTDEYGTKLPQAFNASIGGHYRHCLEHFEILLDYHEGRIDYDARRRDEQTETDPGYAALRTRGLLRLAREIDPQDFRFAVLVSNMISADASGSTTVPSTLGREAMYVVAHAIHHYALIAVMCRLLEIAPPTGFGLAPSTLKHQSARAAG